MRRERLGGRYWKKETGSWRRRRKLRRCIDKAHLPPHPKLSNVILKCSSLFSLDEFAILMILIILKGQQRSFESPSVLSCNQLINWKPFSAYAECVVWCEFSCFVAPAVMVPSMLLFSFKDLET